MAIGTDLAKKMGQMRQGEELDRASAASQDLEKLAQGGQDKGLMKKQRLIRDIRNKGKAEENAPPMPGV